MGIPKRRLSKRRGRQRRAHYKISAPTLTECSQCHAMIRPHHVCPECGYYKNKEVIAVN